MTTDPADELQRDAVLFARPSLIEGLGRLVDLSGSLETHDTTATEADADARAMERDRRAAGHDLRVARREIARNASSR